PTVAANRPRDTRAGHRGGGSRTSRLLNSAVRRQEPLRMANMSYLCVTNAKATYPSWPPRRFNLDRQTVACAVYSVPLLWTPLFRSADIVRKTFTLDGEKIVTEAPLATRKQALRQLDEAVPYFNRLFRREGPLDEYAGFLRQALEGIEYR